MDEKLNFPCVCEGVGLWHLSNYREAELPIVLGNFQVIEISLHYFIISVTLMVCISTIYTYSKNPDDIRNWKIFS